MVTLDRSELDTLASKIVERMVTPRWLKLKAAAQYSGIGQQRLKSLANKGEITGYQDSESGRKDWIFDKASLDEYRLRPVDNDNLIIDNILKSI
jgi:hypothetical protein